MRTPLNVPSNALRLTHIAFAALLLSEPAFAAPALQFVVKDFATSLGARGFRLARKIISGRDQKEVRGGSLALPFCFAFAALLLSMPLFAAPALQLVAKDFSTSLGGVSWSSTRGDAVWRSAHSATNGWNLPVKFGGVVWFDGSGAVSPIEFSAGVTGAVSYVFSVVECADGADFATLFDAPCPVRFDGDIWRDVKSLSAAVADWEFESELLSQTNSIAINGKEASVMRIVSELQLVEARFDEAVELESFFVGGSPAHQLWSRGWRGGIAELILFSEVPDERVMNAVRRYLAVKFKVAVATESDGGIVQLLAGCGINDDGAFNSVIVVR